VAYKTLFRPQRPEKYLGDFRNIICRSLWERSFAKYCDETPAILHWGSEEFCVPYISPVDAKPHRYFPDFFLEVRAATGIQKFVIEIKPKYQTVVPVKRKRTQRYLTEVMTFAVNQAKWEAATAFCQKNGFTFLVLTEDDLFTRFK